jgi:hypothetical protein
VIPRLCDWISLLNSQHGLRAKPSLFVFVILVLSLALSSFFSIVIVKVIVQVIEMDLVKNSELPLPERVLLGQEALAASVARNVHIFIGGNPSLIVSFSVACGIFIDVMQVLLGDSK